MKDHFKDKATTWDEASVRVNGAKKIADAIDRSIKLTKDMNILDFGVGTGLLGFEVAKKVKQVYGIDTSETMLKKLQEKNTPEIHIKTFHQDIAKEPLMQTYDGVISSMTLHHIKDLRNFFDSIYKNIKDEGFIALADLESEDGTFHSENTGVHHFGFEKKRLMKIVKTAGFKKVIFQRINTINKPHKDFHIFLLTANK